MKKLKNKCKVEYKKLGMYFDLKIAKLFAEHEQNEKNFRVAAIVDKIIMLEITHLPAPIYAAELGGGAHPDRYHEFFDYLLKEPNGHIDWVDVSPYMLQLAKKYMSHGKYKKRKSIISFIKKDIFGYLEDLTEGELDIAIMKYTIDHIKNLDDLFKRLSKKLKKRGVLIATIGVLNPKLKSISTNARFLYKGKEFPENEVRILREGDSFGVKFFKESGNQRKGYIEGAETVKYYHSKEKIKKMAKKHNFKIFVGDWKKYVSRKGGESETMDQDVLVLQKL